VYSLLPASSFQNLDRLEKVPGFWHTGLAVVATAGILAIVVAIGVGSLGGGCGGCPYDAEDPRLRSVLNLKRATLK
jgi:hypothetical protein